MSETFAIPDEAHMAAFGRALADTIGPGERVGLVGDLGAGKTTLARAILRALAGDPQLEVPSPTFTIVQTYDGRIPVRHVDLYRVADPREAEELGLGEPDAAELIEWPRESLPVEIEIAFAAEEDARTVRVTAPGPFLKRLRRELDKGAFLDRAGWGEATLLPLKQDASTRSYQRAVNGPQRAVLMDSPGFTPGPDHYARKARLADGNNQAFLAIGAHLAACGLSAPQAYAADPDAGFILLEDLGDEKIAVDGEAVEERYLAAADALARFHNTPAPAGFGPPHPHAPPRFDADLGLFEVALFPQWVLGTAPDAAYNDLWRTALEALWRGDDHLALRDYHSPNCLWLGAREGIAKVGVIDYQDAMIAPSAYDVVSLAQDARVPVPAALEAAIVARYLDAREGLDTARWREAYAILGAQRAARIAGVFHRLDQRDGKPHYMRHVPVVFAALKRNLAATPVLGPLAEWFAPHLEGRAQ